MSSPIRVFAVPQDKLSSHFRTSPRLRARAFGGNEGGRVGSDLRVCGVKRGYLSLDNQMSLQLELIPRNQEKH